LMIQQICFHRCCSSPRFDTEPFSLDEFLLQCLQRLKSSYLKKCLGVGVDDKLLERSWQMEFYRIATSLLPSSCFISPDVGNTFGTTGDADFYINDKKKWVIELIREGDRLKDHWNKFQPEGLYNKIKYTAAIMLDFRHESKDVRGPKDGIWYVKYNSTYTEATILRKGQSNVKVQFLGDLISSSPKGSELKSIKIAKKSGDIISTFPITQTTTFADLITAAQSEVPSSLLTTNKIIALYSGQDPNTSVKFPSSYHVQDCVSSIVGSTIFLHIIPKPTEEKGFL